MEVMLVVITIIGIVLLVSFLTFFPVNLWISAQSQGLKIQLLQLIGMKIRNVDPKPIIESAIFLRMGGIEDVSIDSIEAHYLAGGNVMNIARAMVLAKKSGMTPDFKYITALELSGNNPEEAILEYQQPKELEENNLTFLNKKGESYNVGFKTTVRRSMENPHSLSILVVVDYIKRQIEEEIYNTDSEPINIDSLINKIKNNSVKATSIDILDLKIYIKEPLRF